MKRYLDETDSVGQLATDEGLGEGLPNLVRLFPGNGEQPFAAGEVEPPGKVAQGWHDVEVGAEKKRDHFARKPNPGLSSEFQ